LQVKAAAKAAESAARRSPPEQAQQLWRRACLLSVFLCEHAAVSGRHRVLFTRSMIKVSEMVLESGCDPEGGSKRAVQSAKIWSRAFVQFALRTGNYGLARHYLERLIPAAVKNRDKLEGELQRCRENGFADTLASAGLPYDSPHAPGTELRYLRELVEISVRACARAPTNSCTHASRQPQSFICPHRPHM
jgi:hypothetical protein